MLKKLVSLILVLCLTVGITSSFTASAAIVEGGNIVIDTVSGVTGDTVLVPVKMVDNPGIMAITVSITYNADALEYERYYFGDIVKDYTVVAHPDKNLIRFVNCESKDRTHDGTLLTLQFKIKDDAEAELHKIDIEYSAGDFCNWSLDKIMPEITSGGVDVAFNGNNCSHKKYGEWTVAAEGSCTEGGRDQRKCETCGHIDLRDNDPIGHEYSEYWTVDQPATLTSPGIMSRYCIRCEDYVDRMNFSLEQTKDDKIDNTINADIPLNEYTESIFKEQFPDKELSESNPSYEKDEVEAPEKDTFGNIIESIIPETEEGSKDITADDIIEKLREAFPNYDSIMSILKAALIILAVIVL